MAIAIAASACSRSYLAAGSTAPDFRADGLTGRTVYLNAELGRPVVLTFFATWCKPCMEEIPRLIELHRLFGGRLKILCIVVDPENKDKVRSIASALSIPFPMLMDEGQKIRSAYSIRGLPATFLVGTDGRIRSRFSYIGEAEARALADAVRRLLVARFINTVAFGRRCTPPRYVARRLNTTTVFALLAPCGPGASTASIRHHIYEPDHLGKEG